MFVVMCLAKIETRRCDASADDAFYDLMICLHSILAFFCSDQNLIGMSNADLVSTYVRQRIFVSDLGFRWWVHERLIRIDRLIFSYKTEAV